MTAKPIATLPPEVAGQLREARLTDQEQFDSLVLGLRAKGWPLRSIAAPFNVTRVTAKNWETQAQARQAVAATQVPTLPLDTRGSKVRAKRIPRDVPSKDRERIRALSLEARKVRRWTDKNSTEQRAAIELEDLINTYVLERRVPVSTFAKYAGVTRRAIMQRIEKIRED